MAEDFLTYSMVETIKLIKEKKLSPVEIMKATLKEIEKENPRINAFVTVDAENALKKAFEAERNVVKSKVNLLHGIPIGVKDVIHTKGLKTTYGSPIFKDYIPDGDAFVVELLHESGAIIVGKHVTHQFAYGPTGDRSHQGPSRNPHDETKMTGGSSGGSAASVAAYLNYAAVGTDTGGSIRIPAAFCGVVGMKPTFGTVSNEGVHPLVWSMDHVGPLTRTVEDNAFMLNVLSQFNCQDYVSIYRKKEDFTRLIGESIKGKVIGIPKNFFYDDLDEDIEKSMQHGIKVLENAGAEIRYIHLDHIDRFLDSQRVMMRVEAYLLHKNNLKEYADLWDVEVKERLLLGRNVSVDAYSKALKDKYYFSQELIKHFKEVEVLLTPTTPILPLRINERTVKKSRKEDHVRDWITKFTAPLNLVGVPSLSMPAGFSQENMPIGLQLIGSKYNEAVIYQIAHAIEQELALKI